jgi:hypothetical protein
MGGPRSQRRSSKADEQHDHSCAWTKVVEKFHSKQAALKERAALELAAPSFSPSSSF